jgi:hypothetical protein
VLVFKGKWDNAESLLEEANIAYSTASRGDGLQKQLDNATIAILNCPAELTPEQMVRLQKWVREGGCLLSTDWALDGSVDKMFPGYIVWKGAYSMPETIDAVKVDATNSLTRGLPPTAPWRLADKCEIVELAANRKIDVLIRSRALTKEDPNALGILACSFQFGRGTVMHLVGHFENNDGLAFKQKLQDPAPEIKISMRQALALNFIGQALEHKDAPDQSQLSSSSSK